MKSKIFVALVLGVLSLVAGCKKGDPMEGTWNLVLDPKIAAIAKGASIKAEFKDSKFTVTPVGVPNSAPQTGTYKLEGKSLTMTPDGKATGPAQTVTLSDDMKSFDLAPLGKMVKQ